MHRILALATLIATAPALACENHLPLEGSLAVDTCHVGDAGCVYAAKAVFDYFDAQPEVPGVLTVGSQSSPWRVYGPDGRIATVDEFAAMLRKGMGPDDKSVALYMSWSGVSPAPGVPSLAERLSKAMGLPVTGMDGFLWIDHAGKMRTTHQAFTVRRDGGPYGVKQGAEVLVPLAVGWAAGAEDKVPDNADLLLAAATGWDVFMLCPDKALAGFEAAANKGSAIGAYNAGLMHLERAAPGDLEQARTWFERGAARGDAKSAEQAAKLRDKGQRSQRPG
jgi:hypothetical protein